MEQRKTEDQSKQARLTVLIDPKNKEAFDELCASRDQSASEVVRQLIVEYLARHGVQWPTEDDSEPASTA